MFQYLIKLFSTHFFQKSLNSRLGIILKGKKIPSTIKRFVEYSNGFRMYPMKLDVEGINISKLQNSKINIWAFNHTETLDILNFKEIVW